MNNPKSQNLAAILELQSPNTKAIRAKNQHDGKCDYRDKPNFGPKSDCVDDRTIDTIRYANAPDGLLSHRDEDVLRRYILDSETFQMKAENQIGLFKSASVRLSCLPSEHKSKLQKYTNLLNGDGCKSKQITQNIFGDVGVVNCGLFVCPVVVTFAQSKKIFKRLPLDHFKQEHVARFIEQALATCCATPLAFARVEAMIALDDMNSVTPLQVQTAVNNESRRVSGDFSPTAVHIPESMRSKTYDSFRNHQAGWSLKLPQVQDVWTEIGPDKPVAFLLVVYMGWPRHLRSPVFTDGQHAGRQKLQALLEGYLAQDTYSGNGEIGAHPKQGRVNVRVDHPMFIHDALTTAQTMQFQTMAKRASESKRSFELTSEQRGFIQHWIARISPLQDAFAAPKFSNEQSGSAGPANIEYFGSSDAPRVVVEQIYDAFWRPEGHVLDIENAIRKRLQKIPASGHIEIDGNENKAQRQYSFDFWFRDENGSANDAEFSGHTEGVHSKGPSSRNHRFDTDGDEGPNGGFLH
jgi:hypothetical protein